MMCPDEHLNDGDKTIFHWCQEGSIGKVKDLLTTGGHLVNQLDSQVASYSYADEKCVFAMSSIMLFSVLSWHGKSLNVAILLLIVNEISVKLCSVLVLSGKKNLKQS